MSCRSTLKHIGNWVILGRGLKYLVCNPAEQESADSQMHGGQEVAGGFVVARGDPPELLDFAEEPLDEIARPVGVPIKRAWRLPAGPRRNDRGCARPLDQLEDGVGVIRPVADHRLVMPETGEKRLRLRAVGRLARGQEHGLHHLVLVDAEMDLGRPSAAAQPDLRWRAVPVDAHRRVEAMTLAEKIVVLNKGQIAQAGSPLDLYNDPDNLFLAGFLGSPAMNFLSAEVAERELRIDGFESVAIEPPSWVPKGKVTIGLRPKNVQLLSDGGSFQVEFVERLGDQTIAHVRLPLNDATIAAVVGDQMNISSSTTVTFSADHVLFFDPETGQRIRPSDSDKQSDELGK